MVADPAKKQETAQQHDAEMHEEVVHSSYDAALDPDRLPDLIGPWEKVIQPAWRMSPQTRRDALERSGFMRHLIHIEKIVGLGANTPKRSPEEEAIQRYRRAGAFTLDRKLIVSAANEGADRSLGLKRCDPLANLQVREEDVRYLSHVAMKMLHAPADSGDDQSRIVRARRLSDDRLILLFVHRVDPSNGTPFVLIATTAVHWPPDASKVLREAYGLTPAEAEIMMSLTRFHSLQDIAESRGRSLETVRAQIKSIVAKTEARGQTDLMRIAMATMDLAPDLGDRDPSTLTSDFAKVSRGGLELSPLPYQTLDRPDGRKFDYLEFGDPKGRPVIYFSSTFGLCRWPASAEFAAYQTGLRIITPIRSGFGGSTPLRPDQDRVGSFAQDVLALMDHLDVGSAPLLVADEDMVYAARLFRLAPDRVRSVVGIAAFLPMTRTAQYERMGHWHRFVLGTARYTPRLLPFVVQLTFAMARHMGKAEFIRRVFSGSEADIAMTRNWRAFEAVDSGSDIVLNEGFDAAKAYAQEISIVHSSDWRSEFKAMADAIPVLNIVGTEDQGILPETYQEFLQDYPKVDMILVEGAGSFLFFEKWDKVLDLLAKQVRNNT